MQLSNKTSATNLFIFGKKDDYNNNDAMAEARDFYDSFYSPNMMTVCLSSNKSLAEMEKFVKVFKEMKNKKAGPPNLASALPYGPGESRRVVKMHTDALEPEMRIIWTLPYYGDKIMKMNLKYFMELF